jgi:1-aminocyclopropane-1-carboxylate synthase
VHLLVDEVYALQVFSSRYVPDPTPFVSITSLDVQTLAGCNPSRIHVLAGPTKDFGASGLKVGTLISQHNPDLLLLVERAIQALPMSSASDALFTQMLNDVSFRDWFLEENRHRLGKAFEVVGDWCTFHKLPYDVFNVSQFCSDTDIPSKVCSRERWSIFYCRFGSADESRVRSKHYYI